MPGPVRGERAEEGRDSRGRRAERTAGKPWYIGIQPEFRERPSPPSIGSSRRKASRSFTRLHDTHKSLGAKMVPFAGWDMPVWYTSVVEEHLATRQAAGLFDVSHMGVYEVRGRMRPPSSTPSAPTIAAVWDRARACIHSSSPRTPM